MWFLALWEAVASLLDLLWLLIRVKLLGRRIARAARLKARPWSVLSEWKKQRHNTGAFVMDESLRQVSYEAAEELSDEVARWVGAETEVVAGETVAMVMGSSLEFVVVLLGLAKARCPAALVNVALRGASLSHALTDALGERRPRLAIADADMVDVCRAAFDGVVAAPNAAGGPRLVRTVPRRQSPVDDDDEGGKRRRPFLGRPWTVKKTTTNSENAKRREDDDVLAYVYTSGTTGFPKAAKIGHGRAWAAGTCLATLCRLSKSDVVYNPLPLYHATGGLMGLWGVVRAGSCLVVRRKFSASRFGADLRASKATGCLYIGEMARYVVDQPPEPAPIHLRFAFGNGMPRDAWKAFETRFGVRRLVEFYGSTEGNVNLFNNLGVFGACGIVPRPLLWLYPIVVARLANNADPPELARDAATGLCVPAKPNEPGELLGRIDARDPSRRFDGYVDKGATQRKIARDVLRRGDSYFRSGDLVAMDRIGFIYFLDRMGDTFRWKGENVSTCEVANAALRAAPDILAEALVFGVKAPGPAANLGKCGMLACVLRDDKPIDWSSRLYSALERNAGLPPYALPRFLRCCTDLPKTATHKYVKAPLIKDAIDSAKCSPDPLYVRDPSARAFVAFDDDAHARILDGRLRL